jgi:hypothetical protein
MKVAPRKALIFLGTSTLFLMTLLAFVAHGLRKSIEQEELMAKQRGMLVGLRKVIGSYEKKYGLIQRFDNHSLYLLLAKGENPAKIRLLDGWEGIADPKREAIIDLWGHDVRFERRANGQIEADSAGAGPNGAFGTNPDFDDISSYLSN